MQTSVNACPVGAQCNENSKISTESVTCDDDAASLKLVAVAREAPMPDGSQVYEFVWQTPPSVILPSVTLPENGEMRDADQTCIMSQRKREKKRPFSPDIIIPRKKIMKKKITKKPKKCSFVDDDIQEKKFSCEKCSSPYVVNPLRSHPTTHKQRAPRRVFDPSTQKIMLLCNACGLTARRINKKSEQKETNDLTKEKEMYLEEAERFASSLASDLQEDDARRLYCPAFKTKACRCLQDHIMSAGPEEVRSRSLHLINLIKDAKLLVKQKCTIVEESSDTLKEKAVNGFEESNSNESTANSDVAKPSNTRRGLCNRRSKAYESFVLKNRHHLKTELRLCERACQRVLMYSNNFLHRQLKTSPNQNARVERTLGRNAKGLLHPISEIASLSCCGDGCVALAHTHPRLLESWRSEAAAGQRRARRALAEMLTPSGGTKANCYKFISLVTGCSYTTICQVSEQMRRTKGDREPHEHGLKRWWREHRGTKNAITHQLKESSPKPATADNSSLSELQQERQRVEELTQELQRTQERLQQLEQTAKVHLLSESYVQPQQQIVHVVEIPHSQVLTGETASVQILNVSGELETLTNIGVSLPTMSSVVVLSDTTMLHPDPAPAAAFGGQLIPSADTAGVLHQCDVSRVQFLE
ncbi:uncharacterized protein LOC126187496 [Schistocerca cancellata]|uniref:uncharacterized protein LOC126187496 n=1 Tax=Schistocerca cancellata TaxID=274614 RepID=UPI0021179AAB|nr:uncharacterized protein LOC126187496 [Schistocerca cancellata]